MGRGALTITFDQGTAGESATPQTQVQTTRSIDIDQVSRAHLQALARHIRESRWGQELCLIALTGYGQLSDRAISGAAGFDAHLVKPVQADQLLSVLRGRGGRHAGVDSAPPPPPACPPISGGPLVYADVAPGYGPAMATERYFEDLKVGQKFTSGTVQVTAERIKTFAAEFDPQPFHLDEVAAQSSLFKGLAASGWHTAAITMRLLVTSDLKLVGGTIGGGGEDLRWPRPVRPGDVLRLEIEVIDLRPSQSRPELGIAKIRLTTFNQRDEIVQLSTPVLMTRRRPQPG